MELRNGSCMVHFFIFTLLIKGYAAFARWGE
jgi:hypothetical protein